MEWFIVLASRMAEEFAPAARRAWLLDRVFETLDEYWRLRRTVEHVEEQPRPSDLVRPFIDSSGHEPGTAESILGRRPCPELSLGDQCLLALAIHDSVHRDRMLFPSKDDTREVLERVRYATRWEPYSELVNRVTAIPESSCASLQHVISSVVDAALRATEPRFLNLVIDAERRTVRRLGPEYVHIPPIEFTEVTFHSFLVFYRAGTEEASEAEWRHNYPGEWDGRHEVSAKLNKQLRPLDVRKVHGRRRLEHVRGT